jgi:hypothetical protein
MFEIEQCASRQPVKDVVKRVILSSFCILSALTMRDLLVQTFQAMVPQDAAKRLVFVYFHSLIIIMITLLFAYYWQDIELGTK